MKWWNLSSYSPKLVSLRIGEFDSQRWIFFNSQESKKFHWVTLLWKWIIRGKHKIILEKYQNWAIQLFNPKENFDIFHQIFWNSKWKIFKPLIVLFYYWNSMNFNHYVYNYSFSVSHFHFVSYQLTSLIVFISSPNHIHFTFQMHIA